MMVRCRGGSSHTQINMRMGQIWPPLIVLRGQKQKQEGRSCEVSGKTKETKETKATIQSFRGEMTSLVCTIAFMHFCTYTFCTYAFFASLHFVSLQFCIFAFETAQKGRQRQNQEKNSFKERARKQGNNSKLQGRDDQPCMHYCIYAFLHLYILHLCIFCIFAFCIFAILHLCI